MENKTDLKERLRKERNTFRTTAEQLTSKYDVFRKKCIDLKISYKDGLERAIDLFLQAN